LTHAVQWLRVAQESALSLSVRVFSSRAEWPCPSSLSRELSSAESVPASALVLVLVRVQAPARGLVALHQGLCACIPR